MLDFTKDEIELLMADGYEPGFMMDLREGDMVAIPPVMRNDFDGSRVPVKSFVVRRILAHDASYYEQETDRIVPHTVINFIGMDLDNIPQHCAYGCSYPCFIKRENNGTD